MWVGVSRLVETTVNIRMRTDIGWKEASKRRMNQNASVAVVHRRNSWMKMRGCSGPEQGGPSRSSWGFSLFILEAMGSYSSDWSKRNDLIWFSFWSFSGYSTENGLEVRAIVNSIRSRPTTVKSNTNTTPAYTIANLKNWTCLEKTDNYSELSHLSFEPHALVGSLAHLRRATMLHSSIRYSKRYMKPPPSPSKFSTLFSILSLSDNPFFYQENRRNQERNPIPPTSNPSIHL